MPGVVPELPETGSQYLAAYSFAPWGAAAPQADIAYIECTLTPGAAPLTQSGEIVFGSGLSTVGETDTLLIQLIQNPAGADDSNSNLCGAASGEWCVITKVERLSGGVWLGKGTAKVGGNDKLQMKYVLNDDQETWTVQALLNGKLVSELHVVAGRHMNGFGMYNICKGCQKATSIHEYDALKIVLVNPDPRFGRNALPVNSRDKVTADTVITVDGGLTWTLQSIAITGDQQ